jgi:hypothetical protein
MEAETADYYRRKAEQCRRLAGVIIKKDDPVVANPSNGRRVEAKAVALTAEEANERQIGATEAAQKPEPSRH